MKKAKDKTGEGEPAAPADFSRLADAFKEMPVLPLHPLLAHPTAAFMAAAAMGFGIATQLTGVMLGALQGAAEAGKRTESDPAEQGKTAEDKPEPAAAPVAAPVKAKVVAKSKKAAASVAAKTTKPAAAKPATVKQVTKPATQAPKPKAAKGKASAKEDDLKRIGGIGPKAEQMLKARGITRFSDIAGWSKADIARIDGELGLGGRVERDDWVGQAKALMGGAA
ncbi:hypothetical protein M8R20_06665 [Pseudomonas sp. R2.Fl]|nr:hypothetical protein [Pseudomonas sp. R2.Fl]